MNTFFSFLASLSLSEGLIAFILICLTLAAIPYSKRIGQYLRHFVLQKELKIVFFTYRLNPDVFIGQDEHGRDLYASNPSKLLIHKKTIIHFVWKVEGAYRVDFLPIKENIQGNGASLLADREIENFRLVAYGFKGEQITAELDLSGETFYALNTYEIASQQHIVRKIPAIFTTQFHQNQPQNHHFTDSVLKLMGFPVNKAISWRRETLPKMKMKGMSLDKLLKNKVLRNYRFSTKKYSNLN